jgi:hypothetical protein
MKNVMSCSQVDRPFGVTSLPQKPPVEARAPKFFLINMKVSVKPKGIELLNGPDVFQGSPYRTFSPPGPLIRGFRDYPVRPVFRISRTLGRLPHDIEFDGAFWFVTDRAKDVLTGISEPDFAFLKVDTVGDSGEKLGEFWLCDVVTMLDAVDAERSTVTTKLNDMALTYHEIIAGGSLKFNQSVVGPHHAFRLTTNFATIVCDEKFRLAIKAASLTGLSFKDASAF